MAHIVQFQYTTIDFVQHGLLLELYESDDVGGTFSLLFVVPRSDLTTEERGGCDISFRTG